MLIILFFLIPQVVALPKKDILLSLPFWGLMIGALGYDFGFYTLLTELPTYLKNIQHFDMSEVGTRRV